MSLLTTGIATPEEARMIQDLERRMNSGDQPFVDVEGMGRCAFDGDVLDECGVKTGEKVGFTVYRTLLHQQQAKFETMAALGKISKEKG